jgi:predicted RND superfamily exporter protein
MERSLAYEACVRLVDACRRFAWLVAFLALAATVGMGNYVATHFKMNTDINQLIAEDLGWRKLEKDLELAFPQKVDRLVIVVDGSFPDQVEAAAEGIASALRKKPELFKTVTRPEAIPYFQKNGLLFLSEEELTSMLETLVKAQPMLGSLARILRCAAFFQR